MCHVTIARSKMRTFILVAVVLIGCGKAETSDKERLLEISKSAKGHLTPLLVSPAWSGDRLRVASIENGRPVTASIGPWNIQLVPDIEQNVVQIKGLAFADDATVTLDMDQDVLAIDGHKFAGKAIEATSPMFDNLPFKGVSFERVDGPVYGKAAVIFLDDGRVAMDFDKVYVDGKRAREYGAILAQ
jgi:hypothetical protein